MYSWNKVLMAQETKFNAASVRNTSLGAVGSKAGEIGGRQIARVLYGAEECEKNSVATIQHQRLVLTEQHAQLRFSG